MLTQFCKENEMWDHKHFCGQLIGPKAIGMLFWKYTISNLVSLNITVIYLPYPSGLLHWHMGSHMNVPAPAKQPWMNDMGKINKYLN